MVLSLFLSRVLGIVRDQAMVWTFGRGELTDAYRWAFQIPDLLFFLIAGGALSSAFIPVFSEYLHTDREREAWHIFSVVATVMSLVVAAFIVVAWVYAVPLTSVVAPGHSADHLRSVIAEMSRIILPAQFAFFIGGLMFGTLYAKHMFAIPGLGPNVYNFGIIFGAVAISHFVSPGIVGMAWGALIGATVGNLLIPMAAMRRIGGSFRPSLDVRHPGVKRVFVLMLPVVLGLSLPGVYGLIMQRFSSFFVHGTATALDIANRLMQAPLGIFGQSLAIAVFPALSQFYAQKRMDLFQKQLAATLRTVIYITVPISVLMYFLAPEIVAALYQYGSKFGATDTDAVASCLRMFSFGIVAWCLHPVLMRGFFAVQSSVVPIAIGTGTTVLFWFLCVWLKDTSLGYLGLPLASAISAVCLAFAMLFSVSRKVGGIDLAGVFGTLGKSCVSALPLAVVVGGGQRLIPHGHGVGHSLVAIGEIGLLGIAGAWAYYFASRGLGMPETTTFNQAIAKMNRRRRT